MSVFLICPVREAGDSENGDIAGYVEALEATGVSVYWPKRDTDQIDTVGLRICRDNFAAIRSVDEVHVWWQPTSRGSLFDLGGAFMLGKPIRIANRSGVIHTDGKSFENLLIALDGQ